MEAGKVENRVAAELEKNLKEFDQVILIDERKLSREFQETLYTSETLGKDQKKTLILSGAEDKKQGSIVWRCTAGKDFSEFLRVYFLYEFSDHISLISKEHTYGGILNLVETGILTLEEAQAALLY